MTSSSLEETGGADDFKMRGARLRDRLLLRYARTPEHPAKQRILMATARFLNPHPTILLPSGGLLRFPHNDYLGWSMLQRGQYEPRSLELISKLLRETPGLFVDVGANVGLYTVLAAGLPGVRVIALEPDCSNCNWLRKNVKLNDFDNVDIFNGGASSQTVIAAISRRQSQNSGSAFTTASLNISESADWVSLLTLEEVLDTIARRKERPVLVKLDVEGGELDVLLGLKWDGCWRPRNILMEFNSLSEPVWGSFTQLAAFFTERGYEVTDVSGRQVVPGVPLPDDNLWIRDAT